MIHPAIPLDTKVFLWRLRAAWSASVVMQYQMQAHYVAACLRSYSGALNKPKLASRKLLKPQTSYTLVTTGHSGLMAIILNI